MKKDFFIILIVILLSVVFGFGAGYLARGEIKKSPIIIEKAG